MLEHSWFPKGGEFGEHSWYDEDAINWQKMKIKGRKYLDLADFSPYLDDTGLKNLSLDDWIETISYVAKSTGYEDFEIKRSPSGEKILLLEMLPSGTDYAVEIHQNGDVFFIEKGEDMHRVELDSVQEAMDLLESNVKEETGISANWSHVNRSLATALTTKKAKQKGFIRRLFFK